MSKGRTISFHKDNFARREIERLDAKTSNIPQLTLWGSYVQEQGVSKTSITPEDFTLVDVERPSLQGAKNLMITIEGIHGSGNETHINKAFTLTVTDIKDETIAKISDGNAQATSEVFFVGVDSSGLFCSECHTNITDGTTAVSPSNTSSFKVFGKYGVTGETAEFFLRPEIKSFTLEGINNNTNYAPVTYKVYAEF